MDKQEIRNALLETAVSFDTIKERAYWEEVKRQRAEIERLRKALDKYGGHRSNCDVVNYNLVQIYPNIHRYCTCGFEQALKEE